jgi:hypothetical protein|tara:strand:- start:689 stop:889 length:201 start_codon:yes stop_codon:yes gene_type:complete
MYNTNNPSNWSWSKAFDEMAKTVNQAELTQQVINHLAGYPGDSHGEYVKLNKQSQDDVYEILGEIL